MASPYSFPINIGPLFLHEMRNLPNLIMPLQTEQGKIEARPLWKLSHA